MQTTTRAATDSAIAAVWRIESAKIVAGVARLVRDIGLAEELAGDALVAALEQGRIAGAGLDVYDEEPLPPDHPLWTCPGVLISPHVGGASTAFEPRALAFLRAQLGRFGRGEPLAHVVAGED